MVTTWISKQKKKKNTTEHLQNIANTWTTQIKEPITTNTEIH